MAIEASMSAPDARLLLISVKEMRQRLSIGHGTAYKLIAKGEVESLRIGRARRITVRSIDAYVARRLAQSATSER
jgi:excisionase family DNA binding protein